MERIFSSLNHAHSLSIGDGATLRAPHHHHHHRHDAARLVLEAFTKIETDKTNHVYDKIDRKFSEITPDLVAITINLHLNNSSSCVYSRMLRKPFP